jgi:hypothetical protein
MKKIMIFAVVLAIAMTTALEFGLIWLFIGIAICFLCEVVVFDAGGIIEPVRVYKNRIKNSRTMLLAHACWYCGTLLCAAAFGLLNGYNYTVETAVGNYNFEYETMHQSGDAWYMLVVMLLVRGIMQLVLEKRIRKDIGRAKNLPA